MGIAEQSQILGGVRPAAVDFYDMVLVKPTGLVATAADVVDVGALSAIAEHDGVVDVLGDGGSAWLLIARWF